jgi:large conductance mechanosensitive channel
MALSVTVIPSAILSRTNNCKRVLRQGQKGSEMQNVQKVTSAGILTEFRNFLLRGNIIDLAIAVVLGVAFGAVVTSMVDDIIMPIIGIFGGSPDFSSNTFTINGSEFRWGNFVTQVISFILIAAAIFFVVVKPVNIMNARVARGEASPDPATRACPECLSMVPTGAARCMYCAQPLPPVEVVSA